MLTLLPTPTASSYGYNQSASAGAAVRKSLDGVVRDLFPTPTAQVATNGGTQDPAKRRAGGHSPTIADVVEYLDTSVTPFGKYQAAVDRWTAVYGHEPPTPTLPDGRGGNHRLNPAFSQWMMGAMHVHLEPLDRKQRLQAIGNAVCPQQAKEAYSQLLKRMNSGRG